MRHERGKNTGNLTGSFWRGDLLSRYASGTGVSVGKTKGEIEDLLIRYGAEQFVAGWSEDVAVIGFVFDGRHIKFELHLPDRQSDEFWYPPSRRTRRSKEAAHKAWEQGCRARWRALLLVIKAKLEAVECGISSIEMEFMPWTVIPGGGGETVGERVAPELSRAIETGNAPRLTLGGGA